MLNLGLRLRLSICVYTLIAMLILELLTYYLLINNSLLYQNIMNENMAAAVLSINKCIGSIFTKSIYNIMEDGHTTKLSLTKLNKKMMRKPL